MIFLTDEMPSHCPSCGKEHKTDSWAASDFNAGASSQCKCGAMWQYVPTAQLIEASNMHANGDLHRYA